MISDLFMGGGMVGFITCMIIALLPPLTPYGITLLTSVVALAVGLAMKCYAEAEG